MFKKRLNPSRILLRLGLFLLLTLSTACASTTKAEQPSPSPPAISLSDRQRHIDKVLDTRIVRAQNHFGLRLHQVLTKNGDGGNLILSPYSIATSLSMAYSGSAGETEAEMSKALGYQTMKREEVQSASKVLQELEESPDSGVRLNIANAVWYAEGIPLKNSFQNTVKDNYHASVEPLDFSSDKSVVMVNNWVKKQTNGKINQLLSEPPGSDMVSLIVNAIYFNGTWKTPFDEKLTENAVFTTNVNITKQVPMMKQGGSFAYAQNQDWQAIRIPYGSGQMNMLIILPSEQSSLPKLEEQLWKDMTPWEKNFEYQSGQIRIPRFKAEYKQQLNKALMGLGMKNSFLPQADFSNMSDRKPLFISNVMHKTVLEVNERGTEAAAVTSLEMAGSAPPEKPFDMVVNRPFFFAIEDAQTKLWLFMGSINDPATE
ncbi:serpin family protein [Paenibacillus pini]|uniref:Serine protease inhibitor n=1 Tax=Paenibacillus pini JCM 16418 TaxID=1236976 RepID=W7YY69_9BACL|nr:serpin family protein [Paenibacillus pini]GAF09576.1 serine protease inhibitor [Paenibacillus pini JCM 16418]